MELLKSFAKVFIFLLFLPIFYVLVALLLTYIPVNKEVTSDVETRGIYLSTNGVHLDIIIPVTELNQKLKKGLELAATDQYCAFGWGDKNFYLHTPTWEDLTFWNAFQAAFLKSTSLMHVTRYEQKYASWVKVKVNKAALFRLNQFIASSFIEDARHKKIVLPNKGYAFNDDFYQAKGSSSCLYTCNTWVNSAFKDSGLKACLWTPFDYGLINRYQ